MHKRMGELRNNPYESGVWLRTFGWGTRMSIIVENTLKFKADMIN